jgi:O-methyltransferase
MAIHSERMTDAKLRYIDLLKKALTCYLYRREPEFVPMRNWHDTGFIARLIKGTLIALLRPSKWRLTSIETLDERTQSEGRGYSRGAHTMIGLKRLANIEECVATLIKENIPGDFIETGAWRGGSTIFMRGLLWAHEVSDRTVWVADSFAGLPKPDPKHAADSGAYWHEYEDLAVSLEEVQENFKSYNLLDSQVRFLKGWFSDTLPTAPIEKLAILRLDGDMYGSTMDALNALYHKLEVGGFLIVDDYNVPACQKAILDFRQKHGITEQVQEIDWAGVYWRKEKPTTAAPKA